MPGGAFFAGTIGGKKRETLQNSVSEKYICSVEF